MQKEDGQESSSNVNFCGDQNDRDGNVKFYSLNPYMFPAKCAYFFNGNRLAMRFYIMLFYESIGLSPFKAALLNGLQYFGGMIGNPFWGTLADRMGFHRWIICFLSLSATFTILVQPFLAYVLGSKKYKVCPAIQNITYVADINSKIEFTDGELFIPLLTCGIMFMFFEGSIESFIDAGTLKRVQMSPRKVEIGMQRSLHSVGVSLGSIFFSLSIQYFPKAQISCYSGIFLAYFVFGISTAIASLVLYRGMSISDRNREREGVMTQLKDHLKKFDTIFFLINVFFTGIFHHLYFSFLFVFLKDLNIPTLLMGFSTSLNSLSAVAVYSISEKVMKFLGGADNALCVSCFAWGIRYMCTAYLMNPFYILAIDIFHGFTYSLSKIAALQIIKETSNQLIFTSMCGLKNLLHWSCAYMIANIFGGKLYEDFGSKNLLITMAIICWTWSLVNVAYIVLKKFSRGEGEPYESLQ